MVVILGLIVLLFTLDQHNLTRTLYRPLVSATLVGLLLGNGEEGIIIGSCFELIMITLEQTYTTPLDPAGYFLGGIAGVILSVSCGYDTSSAVSAGVMVGTVACAVEGALVMVTSLLLPPARKAAASLKTGIIGWINILPVLIEGIIFALIALTVNSTGEAFISALDRSYGTQLGWIMTGLAYAGKLMPAVGLAVTLRNISYGEVKEALAGGAVIGGFLVLILGGYSLVPAVLAAFAVGAYDFRLHAFAKNDEGERKFGGRGDIAPQLVISRTAPVSPGPQEPIINAANDHEETSHDEVNKKRRDDQIRMARESQAGKDDEVWW